ncbi:hypothetical protein [Pseudomonas paracarnis]|uniref:hypothetical protein n=1 Tax=Pseudomonas paracarnis TaxID=2750625 RepID=UPI0023DF1057|nr:hypothetical protein [Pseudomonas paracarnis]MDF3188436.1 hypothetical protein [Pseudomonas paracarnis]
MYAPLTDPLALDNAQQWFNDLMTLADPEYAHYRIRHRIEAYRIQALNERAPPSLFNQLIGFLDALVACGVLSPNLGHDFHRRLVLGFESAWMKT